MLDDSCEIQLKPEKPETNLVSLQTKGERTIIEVNGISIGGEEIVVMAGPCAVESFEQLISSAKLVSHHGAKILRGGAFKPRKSPYSFQGLKETGLKYLSQARKETGLSIVTEVMDTRKVELVHEYTDIFQIGSRSMNNFALLKEVGLTRKPVLLKRGMSSTVDELLLAAEYILSKGNEQVILCERGIRTFETATRNTLDLNAVPMLKSRTHLPVIVDPSHGTGVSWMVPIMAKAAVAAGADGLLVEVHYHPETALCDGDQSLHHNEFIQMMKDVSKVAEAVGRKLILPESSPV